MNADTYNIGDTYAIILHNGKSFTGTCAWRRDMDRYDRSTGAYGSSWYKALCNGTHEVYVAPGPCYLPGEEPA